jgi:hypothetical protein
MKARFYKELHPLILPICLVAACSVMVFVDHFFGTGPSGRRFSDLVSEIGIFGFVLGIVLISALSYGAEFQQRTFVLLLSQPSERLRIWREKLLVLVTVILAIGLLQYLTLSVTRFFLAANAPPFALLFVFVMAVVCSATFWTLTARSTIGGIAFTLMAIFLLGAGTWYVADKIGGTHFCKTVLGAAGVLYSAICLWLGWKKFNRMEIRDALAGEDIALPQRFPGAAFFANFLRCRAGQPLRNLIRKEVRLQKSILFLATIFSACWLITLAILILNPSRQQFCEVTFNVLTAFYIPLMAVLSGCVTHGEEGSLGVHTWHLTFPPSALRQWLIKLIVCLGTAFLLAIIVPYFASVATSIQANVGLVSAIVDNNSYQVFVMTSFVVVLSFWAATLTGNTVRAALLTVLVCVGLGMSATLAQFIARGTSGWMSSVLIHLTLYFQTSPFWFSSLSLEIFLIGLAMLMLLLMVQSFRNFRRGQVHQGLPFAPAFSFLIVAFLVLYWIRDFETSSTTCYRRLIEELRIAFESLQYDPTQLPEQDQRRQFTVHELDKDNSLPPHIRAWLAKSTIFIERVQRKPATIPYSVTVSFKDDTSGYTTAVNITSLSIAEPSK